MNTLQKEYGQLLQKYKKDLDINVVKNLFDNAKLDTGKVENQRIITMSTLAIWVLMWMLKDENIEDFAKRNKADNKQLTEFAIYLLSDYSLHFHKGAKTA